MRVIVIIFLSLCSGLCNAQFATFNPIIKHQPDAANFNSFNDDISAKNRECLNFIRKFQNDILDLKLKTNDVGLRNILDGYYDRLQLYKEYELILYQRETELIEMSLNFKKELAAYVPKALSTSNTSNLDPVFEVGLSSSNYFENVWNTKEGKYDMVGQYKVDSEFYLTNNTISFKKGDKEWLTNRWSYYGESDDNQYVIFKDERDQIIFINEESTLLLYFHSFNGEVYQKMTAYDNLRHSKVSFPGINSPDFKKIK